MIFKRSTYFNQPKDILKIKLQQIVSLLSYKGIKISNLTQAYNYFIVFPNKFDGATIVKDLTDIKGLDISAMVHDYEYIVSLKHYKGLKWLKYKLKVDFKYAQNMEKLGKGITIPYSRFAALVITTPLYWLIIKLKIKL